jgi:hypothetical protein
MHSHAIISAVGGLGVEAMVNPDGCFLRTRVDFSAVTTDCQLMGTTRDFEDKDTQAVIDSIVERECSKPYKVAAFHISVQCEPNGIKSISQLK